jgi:hypothetical protein
MREVSGRQLDHFAHRGVLAYRDFDGRKFVVYLHGVR